MAQLRLLLIKYFNSDKEILKIVNETIKKIKPKIMTISDALLANELSKISNWRTDSGNIIYLAKKYDIKKKKLSEAIKEYWKIEDLLKKEFGKLKFRYIDYQQNKFIMEGEKAVLKIHKNKDDNLSINIYNFENPERSKHSAEFKKYARETRKKIAKLLDTPV